MKKAAELSLVGGDPALDFANTAGWHAGDQPTERLTEYGELLGWARHAELLSERERQALTALAEEHPRKAAQALKHAVEVRELVYRIFTALAQGGAPAADDLERVHRERVHALSAARAEWRDSALRLRWDDAGDLLRPVYPVIESAVRLLENLPPGRLRQCGNHPCGWLFVDRSRSGTRRWCSGGDCGNEVRVRRFRKGSNP
jgi:predicted RNA-binding Zn ribbon-like protein